MTPVARTRGLTRRFGAVTAVTDLDLTIPAGKIVGFLGANGAGKTTTMRLLLGLLRPDAGDIELFGQRLAGQVPPSLLKRIGALIEGPSLYPHLTGRENLDIDRRLRGLPRADIDRVLDFVGLDAADRSVAGYSQGMRQRLGLAVALLGRPQLLVLDEPTNGLDPAGIADMRRLLRHLANEDGTTIFLSSHLLSEIDQMANHLIVMRAGQAVYQGATEDFVGRREILASVDRPTAAVALLADSGWRAGIVPLADDHDGSATIRVEATGRDARAEICRLLVAGGHGVDRLSETSTSLEAMFFETLHSEISSAVGDGAPVAEGSRA